MNPSSFIDIKHINHIAMSDYFGHSLQLVPRPCCFISPNFLLLQADLLELPALTKKVKTEADEDYFSSTENLLEVCTELHSYNNDILDKYNCAKLPQ